MNTDDFDILSKLAIFCKKIVQHYDRIHKQLYEFVSCMPGRFGHLSVVSVPWWIASLRQSWWAPSVCIHAVWFESLMFVGTFCVIIRPHVLGNTSIHMCTQLIFYLPASLGKIRRHLLIHVSMCR